MVSSRRPGFLGLLVALAGTYFAGACASAPCLSPERELDPCTACRAEALLPQVVALPAAAAEPRVTPELARPEDAALPRKVPIAITVDDLPGAGPLPTGVTRDQVVERIVAALQAHGVRDAVGFANGVGLSEGPAAAEALAQWHRAGLPFGNHTYSHRSADTMSQEELRDEVIKNEEALGAMMPAKDGKARYFRFPYLERGKTPEERTKNERLLKVLGYRVAETSVDFNDWAWTEGYVRCAAKSDDASLAVLSRAYLEFALASFHWAVDGAKVAFGRPIPHVLLLHATYATASNLDALLTALEREGARFISLDEALQNPAYAMAAKDKAGSANIVLEALFAKKLVRMGYVPRPLPLVDLACR
jgi:peptidoglycan/xylan/chitin deacetylase (PgdA/CDA1 family)